MAELCTTVYMANLINYFYSIVRHVLEISEFDGNDVRHTLLCRKCCV